jgi:UDP-glucose 4-epimerase
MAHYLVTGGAGFIGSHLIDSLIESHHTVTTIDNLSSGNLRNLNPKANLIEGDIRDSDLLKKILPLTDGCFHLAAVVSVVRSHEEWLQSHSINLSATINLLESIKQTNREIPLVYASSAAVYGDPMQLPISEEHPCKPLSAYAADKLGCEHHSMIAWQVYGIPTLGLRLFNVYGPRQDPKSPYSGVISKFMSYALTNDDIQIFGDGQQTRDFIFVHDVVEYFRQAMMLEKKCGQLLNVCTGKFTTITQLANHIKETTSSSSSVTYLERHVGDILHSCGDDYLARKTLDYSAQYTLEEGLNFLFDDYKQAFPESRE